MTIQEFEAKFTIDPAKDIEPHFKLDKTLDIDTTQNKGCYSCKDQVNQETLKSIPWTGLVYCWKCKTLNVIYFSDRMGGNHTDRVECYVEFKKK
jgi:hypothetical protein